MLVELMRIVVEPSLWDEVAGIGEDRIVSVIEIMAVANDGL